MTNEIHTRTNGYSSAIRLVPFLGIFQARQPLLEPLMEPLMEPIVLIRTYTGELYANVNGVARGSVGCRFNESGELLSHTLYSDKLVAKLYAVIAARGVSMPKDGNE